MKGSQYKPVFSSCPSLWTTVAWSARAFWGTRSAHPRLIYTNNHSPLVKHCPIKCLLFYSLYMQKCWGPMLGCHRCPKTESKRCLVQLICFYFTSAFELINAAMTRVKVSQENGRWDINVWYICILILFILSIGIFTTLLNNKILKNKEHVNLSSPLS